MSIYLLQLIDVLPRAICFLFKEDSMKPSLILSYLPNNMFYVSVVRYGKYNSLTKQALREVVFKTQNVSLTDALLSVANWVDRFSDETPLTELNALLSSEDVSNEIDEYDEYDEYDEDDEYYYNIEHHS